MARPRRQVYTMEQYSKNVREGYITNNASTQRFPAYKPIIDGLAVTILNDDYIPPLILAEEESGKTVIVDGGSRTAAFMMIRYGNHKIKPSVENPIIKYLSAIINCEFEFVDPDPEINGKKLEDITSSDVAPEFLLFLSII